MLSAVGQVDHLAVSWTSGNCWQYVGPRLENVQNEGGEFAVEEKVSVTSGYPVCECELGRAMASVKTVGGESRLSKMKEGKALSSCIKRRKKKEPKAPKAKGKRALVLRT